MAREDIPGTHNASASQSEADAESRRARFGGVARLYGEKAVQQLGEGHFAVIGLGGVGSWAAEALARTGVGEITLIEMDDVCVTNSNRQIHALQSQVGKPKLDVMAERLKDINPWLKIHCHPVFLTKNNMRELIDQRFDVVIDAMDAVHIKAALVAYTSAIKVRLITVGASGGKTDPTLVQVSDLGNTSSDAMLAKIRSQLYRYYNFSRDKQRKFRVDAVYSPEQMVYPKPDGSVCQEKTFLESGTKLDCAGGFGSVSMVTGVFGFIAANQAVKRFLIKAAQREVANRT